MARGLGPFASGKAEYDGDPLVPLGGLRQVYLEGAQKIRPNAAWGIGTQIYNIAMENPLYNYMVIEHSHGELGYFPEMARIFYQIYKPYICEPWSNGAGILTEKLGDFVWQMDRCGKYSSMDMDNHMITE